eukprot:Partr_v1_DN26187_c0_g1_i1_m10195 putative Solute carrier family 32 (GABA vesicular transporter), member 1
MSYFTHSEDDGEPLLTQFRSGSAARTDDLAGTTYSSTIQTAFNAGNVIMGVSLLTLPYALKMSGWIIGISTLALFAVVGCSAAKILSACQEFYLRATGIPLLTYGDIGEAAFGPRGRWFIQTIFSLELFCASVALFLLIVESLYAFLDYCQMGSDMSRMSLMLIIWSILTVATWPKSLSILSYGSMLGIMCILNLVVVVYYDGFFKHEAPGSLWDPAETSLWPKSWIRVPISFGIFMAGYAGHACFPGFYASMRNPKQFGAAFNTAYSVGFLIYVAIAAAGYLMFGEAAPILVTDNLNKFGYPGYLYLITMVLIIINPATKYPLTLYPVVMDLEILLFGGGHVQKLADVDRRPHHVEAEEIILPFSPIIPIESDTAALLNTTNTASIPFYRSPLFRRLAFRTLVSTLVLFVAIIIPQFDRVIGILGSLFSITSSVLFPCLCYLAFFKSAPPHYVYLPEDIRRSSSKWNEPDWLMDSDPASWDFVPQWKRVLAVVTFVVFAILGMLGSIWSVLPESIVPR